MKVNHKTKTDRLQLHRETVSALNHTALSQAQGGREALSFRTCTSGFTCG